MRCFDKAILVASVALCFNLSAFSQDITLKANNITVKEAIEQIKKSSKKDGCINELEFILNRMLKAEEKATA